MKKCRIISGMSAAALAASMLSMLPMATFAIGTKPLNVYTYYDNEDSGDTYYSLNTYDYMTAEQNKAVTKIKAYASSEYAEKFGVTIEACTIDDDYSDWIDNSNYSYSVDQNEIVVELDGLSGLYDNGEDNFIITNPDWSNISSYVPFTISYDKVEFYAEDGSLIKSVDGSDTAYNGNDLYNSIKKVNADSVEKLESVHGSTEKYDAFYRYSIPGAEALAVTFSDDTYVDEDSDERITVFTRKNKSNWDYYYNDQLAGKTVYIYGDTLDMFVRLRNSDSYGFKVTKVEAISEEDVPGGTVDVDNVDQFESKHNMPAGYNKTYCYTKQGAEALKITFSDQTSMIDDDYESGIVVYSDDYGYYQSFYNDDLAGKTLIIPGDTVSVQVNNYTEGSYGFKVTSIEEASEDDIITGTKYVTSIDDFKTPHNVPVGYNRTIVYSNDQYEYTKVTFNDLTSVADDGESYITLSTNDYEHTFSRNELAGKSITFSGSLSVKVYAASEGCYGFEALSAEKGDPNDVYGPKTISNEYLKMTVGDEGFSIGTTGGDPDNANDDDCKMLYGFPDSGTSRTSLAIDGRYFTYSSSDIKIDEEADDPTIVSETELDNIKIQLKNSLVTNVATGKADVARISYTYTNTDTETHSVGCKIMMDTMLGDNDDAPFRIPGTGDVNYGKRYIGSDIPQSWQAFDSLTDPTVIAQGSFLRDFSNPPSEVRFTSYNNATETWNTDFANEGEFNGDSAVEVYWYEKPLAPGDSITFVTYYGLSELVQNMTPPLTLSLSGDSFASQIDYDNDKGLPVYNKLIYTAYLNNIDNTDVINATAELKLPEGFHFADKDGNTGVRNYSKIAPGEIVQVDWEIEIDPNTVTELQKYPITLTTNADNDVEKTVSKNVTIPKTLTEKTNINKAEVTGDLSYTYTGSEIIPNIVLKNGETELIENGNYTVEYKNNIDSGTAEAVFTGIGMYSGTLTVPFTINPANLNTLSVILDKNEFVYSGKENKPTATVSFFGATAPLDSSLFTVNYSNNTDAGIGTATITSNSPNFVGSVSRDFRILAVDISDYRIEFDSPSYTYTGEAIVPKINVFDETGKLLIDSYYDVEFDNNVNAGQATATVTGKLNYTGSTTADFTIAPASISDAAVTISNSSFVYTGSAIRPDVTVKLGDKTLQNGKDYTVSYSGNINAGTAKITVTGKGNYTSTVDKEFTITPAAITYNDVTLATSVFTYNGSAKSPAVTVKFGGKTLVSGKDYTVSYRNNTNAGTATATVAAKGNYSGSVSKTFTINAASISNSAISISGKEYVYTGKAIVPTYTVKVGSKTLRSGTDYTAKFSNNKNTGKASVVVTGKGNYKNSKTAYFYIKPKAAKGLKVTSPKTKQLKISWTKDTQTSGYELVIATNKNFTKGKKTYTISKNSTNSKTLKNLKKGQKYFVKVRGFKKIDSKKYYGGYSTAKSITCK